MAIFEARVPKIAQYDQQVEYLSRELNVTRVTASILVNRGIKTSEDASFFLNPSIDQLHDPFMLKDMEKAVSIIQDGVTRKKKITIYGDYDVDGVTSTTIMYLFLKTLGANVDYYIPSRQDEGYGLNEHAVTALAQQNTSILVTVDCGITSFKEIELAQKMGLSVIITDHHECKDGFPDAHAVINPNRDDQSYPFKQLAGVGVAAKLIQAIKNNAVVNYLDLIALGTISDIVPLKGENRVFASLGLRQLNACSRPGLYSLIQLSHKQNQEVTSGSVAYGVAPRLNAAGRISTASKSLRLFTTLDQPTCRTIAEELDHENTIRQTMERELIEAVEDKISNHFNRGNEKIFIFEGYDWHKGLIGIAASKIVEKYRRPTIIISIIGGKGIASARSIKGFNMHSALASCACLFEKFGGHEMAAGFSIDTANLSCFYKAINEYANNNIDENILIPRYEYDAVLKTQDINPKLLDEINLLEPFGMGNPRPKFLIEDAVVESRRVIGKHDEHLKMNISLGQRLWDAVGFGYGHLGNTLYNQSKIDMVVDLQNNNWMGVSKIQMLVKSIHPVMKSYEDISYLLASFEYKFFDAFFNDFMYNRKENEIKKNDGNKFSFLDLESWGNIIKDRPLGNLTVCYTRRSSEIALQYLLDNEITGYVSMGYFSSTEPGLYGNNALVLVPDFRLITSSLYKEIYIFEGDLPFFMASSHMIDTPEIKVIQSGSKNDSSHIDLYFLDRDMFVSVYRWVRSNKNRQSYWPDYVSLLKDLNSKTNGSMSIFQVRMILSIFNELEFLELDESGGYIRINYHEKPRNQELTHSELYQYHKDWMFSIQTYRG